MITSHICKHKDSKHYNHPIGVKQKLKTKRLSQEHNAYTISFTIVLMGVTLTITGIEINWTSTSLNVSCILVTVCKIKTGKLKDG